ncbi:hypothetical protein KXR53_26320 [Inquilinus limosus]|uniref:hypothetical protein n=1 Tax=Inquilinus limosus TaxID=171674 RepID=UPI003F1489DD
MTEPSRDPNGGTPLWVKVQGAFVVLLVLIVISMFAGVLNFGLLPGGGHGMPGGLH